jgi:hypothetical protein
MEKCRCDWSDDGIRPKVMEGLDMLARFDGAAKKNLFRLQFNTGHIVGGDRLDRFDIEDTHISVL